MAAATVRGVLTELRPARDDYADLLVAWHEDEEVSRYWDGKTFTRETMLVRLARAGVTAYIVEADGNARNEIALRAWRNAGFVEISEHDLDGEHRQPWVLMEFRG